MSNYITNLEYALTRANAKSFKYGDGKAWDNVKRKNLAKLSPRGPMFKKMLRDSLNYRAQCALDATKDMIKMFNAGV